MSFPVVALPFANDALEPYLSAKTMMFHHDKHYTKYIENLNVQLEKSAEIHGSLEEVMKSSHLVSDEIFHNAAQAWNHEFYFKSISPIKSMPSDVVVAALDKQFGSIAEFEETFTQVALGLFGSGWVWVTKDRSGEIAIQALENAENPLTSGQIPLLVCDVWEHAYYLDYQNERGRYLHRFWEIINWTFFEKNLLESEPVSS